MKIDSYEFGHIVIDGQSYSDDVIIKPHRVLGDWWRKEGHIFSLADLKDAFAASPDRLILGTGASGICRVLPEVSEYCNKNGVELIIKPTKEAVAEYNAIRDKSTTVAALHLTC